MNRTSNMRLPRNVRKQVDLGQAVPPSSVPIIPESCFALNNLTSVTDLKIEHGDEAGQNHGQNHGHVYCRAVIVTSVYMLVSKVEEGKFS